MLDNGIKSALKSSEVQRQTADLQKKSEDLAVGSSVELPLIDNSSEQNLPAERTLSVESAHSSKQEALSSDNSVLGGEKRGAGRPKGARNKSTREWIEYFIRQYKSPLIFLGEVISQNTDELARKIRADRVDTLKIQVGAANALLPYIHQKQPLAIENVGSELPTINIFTSAATFNQLNKNEMKREIIVDGISSAQPEQISFNNNDLIEFKEQESENKV